MRQRKQEIYVANDANLHQLCCKSKNRLSRVVNYKYRVVITKIGKEYDTEGIIMIMEHLQDGPLVHPVMAHKFNICIKS